MYIIYICVCVLKFKFCLKDIVTIATTTAFATKTSLSKL